MATAFLVYSKSSESARSKIDLKRRFLTLTPTIFSLAALNKGQATKSFGDLDYPGQAGIFYVLKKINQLFRNTPEY